MTVPEETDTDEEEIHLIEAAIRDLKDEDDGDKTDLGDGDKDGAILEEHEAAEVLSTMLQKKKSYTQTLKAKKSKELSWGYSNPVLAAVAAIEEAKDSHLGERAMDQF